MNNTECWTNFIRIHGGECGARDIFEKAMAELLKAENPNREVHVINASQGDNGIDVYVEQEKGIDVYQCKFFMDRMNSSRWQQIKESFDRAMHYEGTIFRWFLCVPLEFQKDDIHRIDAFKKNRSRFNVKIQFIDGNEIINRMQKSDNTLIEKYFNPSYHSTTNKYVKKNMVDNTIKCPCCGIVFPIDQIFCPQCGMILNIGGTQLQVSGRKASDVLKVMRGYMESLSELNN